MILPKMISMEAVRSFNDFANNDLAFAAMILLKMILKNRDVPPVFA